MKKLGSTEDRYWYTAGGYVRMNVLDSDAVELIVSMRFVNRWAGGIDRAEDANS